MKSFELVAPEAALTDVVLEKHQVDMLNTSINVQEIQQALTHLQCKHVALYGPAGTGKTALARWLAAQLGRPLLAACSAELMPIPGNTCAQRLAAVLSLARQQDAVLLLEDADFLLHRRPASRAAWEVSLAHECESALNKHNGIVLAASSIAEVPDVATLRRFDMSVRVDYLEQEHAWSLFMEAAATLGINDLLAVSPRELARLYLLAPADFTTVVRQARFRPVRSLRELYARLHAEFSLRPRPWQSHAAQPVMAKAKA